MPRLSLSRIVFLSVGIIAGGAPSRSLAAHADRPAAPSAPLAHEQEGKGEWLDACRLYEKLWRENQAVSEYREGYQRCLRRLHQSRRHQDYLYRTALSKLTPTQALDLYEQVLAAVTTTYYDRPKSEIGSLFIHGVEELAFALEDKAFVKNYLPGALQHPEALARFRAELTYWLELNIDCRPAAREEVLAIAKLAQELHLTDAQSKVVPVFALEFTCGCCNALDEYTLFLTPGSRTASRPRLDGAVRHDMLSENFSSTVGEYYRAGIITISQFTDSTAYEVNEALIELTMKGAQGAILDLRGNPGGVFKAAIQTTELFIGEGVIVHSEGQVKEYNRVFEAPGGQASPIPLVILIDGETASAAEVMAGALKELGRARLVGQTTFGKGTIQSVIAFDKPPLDKMPAGIRLTVARLLSPSHQPYTGRGITPDIFSEPDATLETAKGALRQLLNAPIIMPPG